MKSRIIESVKETALWYQTANQKDKRNDNLSGCILSRFQGRSDDYNWHIITTEVTTEKSSQATVK